MTNISIFFNKIALGIPLFSNILFCLNWTFISVFVIGLIQGAFSKKKLDLGEVDEEESEDENSLLINT